MADEPVALAMTALEEFWPSRSDRPLVLLGSWCDVDGGRAPGAPFVPDPWDTPEKVAEAVVSVKAVTTTLTDALGEALGSIHRVSGSRRYWRLLLEPWLSLYTSIIADRAAVLTGAREAYGEFDTVLMDEDCFTMPWDTLDFIHLVSDDPYNLQILSFILRHWGRGSLSSRPFSWVRPEPKPQKPSIPARFLHRLSFRADVVMKASYMPLSYELAAAVRTAGRVWSDHQNVSPIRSRPLDLERRARIGALLGALGGGDLLQLAAAGLPRHIPRCFVEDFHAWRDLGQTTFGRSPSVVFSCNAWYYDEAFKQWAAAAGDEGSLLAGAQHGGNYGSSLFHLSEDHEVKISDVYYTWGWTLPGDTSVVPMPATKLMGRRRLGWDDRTRGLLFVTMSWPRYLVEFPGTPHMLARYLEDQAHFVRSLPPELLDEVLLRPHREDLGWHVQERLQQAAGRDLAVDRIARFPDSLEHCRLYVCDHLSTTFMEALASDKPTVLFWDPSMFALRADAEPYYAELLSAGILHHDPESAAEHVAAVYDRVEEWWTQPDLQLARTRFCDRFGRTAPSALGDWLQEFRRLAQESRRS